MSLVKLQKGQVLEIKGTAGSGKTNRAIAEYCYKERFEGNNILLYSAEMVSGELKAMLKSKYIFDKCSVIIPWHDIYSTKFIDSSKKAELIRDAEIELFSLMKGNFISLEDSIEEVDKLWEMISTYSKDLDTIIVDGLDLIGEDQTKYGEVVEKIRNIAKELNVKVIITSTIPDNFVSTIESTLCDYQEELIVNPDDRSYVDVRIIDKAAEKVKEKIYKVNFKCGHWEVWR